MRNVYISGVGIIPFGPDIESTVRSMSERVATDALTDAGVAASDVGFTAFSNAASGLFTGQECIRGQAALRHIGLDGCPMANVENACASGSSAAHLAWLQIASGQCDIALVVGVEKMSHEDRSLAFHAMTSGTDLDDLDALNEKYDGSPNRTIFMDIYAKNARDYMAKTGATMRDFAQVAVKSHDFATDNPIAQFRKRFTEEDILTSRAIIDPLTLPMCSPIGDGAAAIVLVSEDYLAKSKNQRVRIAASVLATGIPDRVAPTAARRAALKAYEFADVSPEDVDVVELHDAAVSAELQLYEDLQLCAPGEGLNFFKSGATQLGGRVPVNPSGGLVSRGHPIGATGCAQLVELTQQLRGQSDVRQCGNPRIALAENGGGWIGNDAAVAAVTILKRENA
ncbi:MAG: thiolase family protein [Thalassovita sp.]